MTDGITRNIVNGIDLDALGAVVGEIQQEPGKALVRFAVSTRWGGQTRSRSTVTNTLTSGRFRISSMKLPMYMLAMKPQKTSGRWLIMRGPGWSPWTTRAPSRIAVAGENVVDLSNIGASFVERQRWTDATGILERALRLDPRYVPALKNLTIAWAAQGDCRRALAPLDVLVHIAIERSRRLPNTNRTPSPISRPR